MQARLYAGAFDALYAGGIEAAFPLQNLYVALVQPSYAFNRAHKTAADIADDELTVDNYIRQPVSHARIVRDEASNSVSVYADDVPCGSLGPGERIGGVVLLQGFGLHAQLRAFLALDKQGTTGGPVIVMWPDSQMLRFTEPSE